MNKRGSSLVSTVLAVAAAAGVGVAGYMMLGDCSSCTSGVDAEAASAVTPVAAMDEGMSCCPAEGEAVEVIAVAAEGESCETACDAEKTDCEGKVCPETGEVISVALTETGEACEGKTECAEKAEACETECEVKCETECEEGVIESVSNEAGECEGKVCPITGQPIADSGQ